MRLFFNTMRIYFSFTVLLVAIICLVFRTEIHSRNTSIYFFSFYYSLFLFAAISIVSCVAVVVVPLIFLTSIDEGTRQLFTSVCIFVCIFTTILILHSWRSVQLLGGYDIDSHLELIRKSNPQITDTLHSVTHHSGSQKDGYYGGNSLNPFEAVKTKNLLNRRQTCNEQVVHWTYLLRKTEALMLVQDEVRPRIIAVDGMHTHFPTVGEDALVEAKQFLS